MFRVSLTVIKRLRNAPLPRVACANCSSGVSRFPLQNNSYIEINDRNWTLKWLLTDMRLKSPKHRHLQMFSSDATTEGVDEVTYENVCNETLDSLCEFFDDVIEKYPIFRTADVSFGDGVLTVNLDKFGTYVINRQSPNKQIWLSSPTSGPKRYDFVPSRNGWVYRHNNETLHSLLQAELIAIIKSPVDLSHCAYCGDI